MIRKAERVAGRLASGIRSLGARPHRRPVIVLGNQKSGSTAIAALLAEMTGLSATLDLKKEMRRAIIDRVKSGSISMAQFVNINRLDFSRQLIKEPSLSPLYEELAALFPEGRFVMVIRDPRDNLRSLLNRFGIAGVQRTLEQAQRDRMSRAWMLVFDGRWLGLDGTNHIEQLAQRWNYIADLHLRHRDALLPARYEDFMRDKVGEIARLAGALGLARVHDIAGRVNFQFQPAGDRDVQWLDFFGPDNLRLIEEICVERMEALQYERTT